jgi:hypothetical protein
MRSRSIFFFAVTALALGFYACSADENVGGEWVEANKKEVIISPYFDNSTNEKFLNVIYENFSQDTIRKLKYQLVTTEGGKTDTVEREIVLKERLKPQDKHLVERPITEKPVTFDRVEVGKVWIKK